MFDNALCELHQLGARLLDDLLQCVLLPFGMWDARIVVIEGQVLDVQFDIAHVIPAPEGARVWADKSSVKLRSAELCGALARLRTKVPLSSI